MTTKKKFLSIILCFSFVLALGITVFGIAASPKQSVCLAATVSASAEVAAPEQSEGGEIAPTPTPDEEQEETHTFLSRVWEFVETHYP